MDLTGGRSYPATPNPRSELAIDLLMSVPDDLPPRSDMSTFSVPLQPDYFEDMFTLTPRLLTDIIESHQGQNSPLNQHVSLAGEVVASTVHFDTPDLEIILADDAQRGDFVPNVSET